MAIEPPQPGTVLAGRFRVERVVGQGGMGIVLAARHLELDERVALKMLGDSPSPDALERLRREARAAARLRGEHIAHVKDFLVLPDGRPLLVMEYVSGRSVAQEIEARTFLPASEAVGIVLGAAEGLAEAHAVGLVHRDVKPSNLILARRPDGSRFVKILDFGVARDESPAMETLTRGQVLLGSPSYMSPEQVMSPRDTDVRADVWSLGVTLHQLVTGAMPFQGYTMQAVLRAVVETEPPRIDALRPDVPKGLAEVVLRCLAKRREDRYRGVDELAAALAPFADPADTGVAARVRRVLATRPDLYRTEISAPPTFDETTRMPSAESLATSRTHVTAPPTPLPQKGAKAMAIAGVLLLTGVLAATYAVGRRGGSGQDAATAPPGSASPPATSPAATTASPASTTATAATATATSLPATAAPSSVPGGATASPPVTGQPKAVVEKPKAAATPPAVRPPTGVDSTDFGGR